MTADDTHASDDPEASSGPGRAHDARAGGAILDGAGEERTALDDAGGGDAGRIDPRGLRAATGAAAPGAARAADRLWDVGERQGGDGEDGAGDEGAGDDDADDLEPPKQSFVSGEWPVLSFDIALLADPEAAPERREAEWRRVYEHFDPYLRYYYEDRLGYRDADEITAAVWRRAFRKIGRLDAPENAWWWLVRLGRNYFLDAQKRERRALRNQGTWLRRMTADAEHKAAPDYECDRLLDAVLRETAFGTGAGSVDLQAFRRAVADLPDRDQEFAYLIGQEERSHAEVVAQLGLVSVEASRARWQWIKRTLHRALGLTRPARPPQRRAG